MQSSNVGHRCQTFGVHFLCALLLQINCTRFLHDAGLAHRHVTLKVFFIAPAPHYVKLGNFGLLKFEDVDAPCTTNIGAYAPPEVGQSWRPR